MKRIITKTTSYGRPRIRVQTHNDDIGKTDESFADDCDVNKILKRFMKTGQRIPDVTGKYNDVSNIPDLNIALTQLNEAQEMFHNMPSHIRKRFGNSPVELVNFLRDPQNYEEGVKLGLLKQRTESTDSAATKRSAVVSQKTKNQQKNNDDDLNDDDESAGKKTKKQNS